MSGNVVRWERRVLWIESLHLWMAGGRGQIWPFGGRNVGAQLASTAGKRVSALQDKRRLLRRADVAGRRTA